MNFVNNNPQFQQQPLGQRISTSQGYTSDGKPIVTDIYQGTSNTKSGGLGVDFSGLIETNVTVPVVPLADQVITATSSPTEKKRNKKKNNSESTDLATTEKKDLAEPVNSKEIVENTVYADTYFDTNNMTYGIINQTDELIRNCKQELDYIRSQRNLKGRYHYINDTVNAMGSLLSTKLSAIKEINNTIKTVNDNEYRRFKDMRAVENNDDNKAVMDAYSAFISAPVGAPEYHLPGTTNLTGGLNGVIQAQYPPNVQQNMDAGLASYLSHLTPEENLMLNDNNKDIEEVIVYDQATGAKYFQWMNTRTNEVINNMAPSSELTIEDFTIDPRTKLAKNTNLNCIKKVVILNEGAFDKF